MSQGAMIVGAVGVMLCCSASSAAAVMMGGDSDKTPAPAPAPAPAPTPTPSPTTPAPIGLYSTTDGIRHQVNNPDGEELFYYSLSVKPWDKYYKFSCKTPSGVESSKLGPYGPVTMGHYHGPKLRIGPAGTKPCGDTNKMHIYRADGSTGTYTDVTSQMKNFADTGTYDGQDTAFTDKYGMGADIR